MSLLEWLFFWLVCWLAGYGLGGVMLGNLGLFKAVPLLLATGLVAFWLAGRVVRIAPIAGRSELVVWLALPVMAAVFFPPFEYIFGGRDPGVYVAVGAGLAKTGRLRFHDSQLVSLAPEERQFYYRLRGVEGNQQTGDSYRLNRQYPGLFATNLDTGEITPQFYPLYPVLLAAGYSLAGLVGELAVTPFIAILALVAVYLLSRELFSNQVALASFTLLLVNYTMVWYSRYPNTEVATMLFFFGGCWLFARSWRRRSVGLALIAALVLGAVMLLRIDSLLLWLPLLLLGFGAWSAKDRRLLGVVVLTLSLFLLGNVLEGWVFSWPYFRQAVLGGNPEWFPWVVVLMFFPAGWFLFNPFGRWSLLPTRFKGLFISLLTLGLFVLLSVWQIVGVIAPSASDWANLFKLEWYLTPPVILIGVWGIWRLLIRRWHEPPTRFLFSYALLVMIFYLYKARVSIDHPWWVRRYLPVVVPALIVSFSWLVCEWSGKLGRLGKVFVFGFIITIYSLMSVLAARIDPFQGALRLLAGAAAYLSPDAVVVADDDWGFLATPLYYLYDRRIVPLNPDQPAEARARAIEQAVKIFSDRQVWFYSFGQSGSQLVPSDRYRLVMEQAFVTHNYINFDSPSLAPGETYAVTFRLYGVN